jgi:uncharacterized membrane protein
MNIKTLKSNRITSLDLLKDTIMIIMALDYIRNYFHFDAFFSTQPIQKKLI